MIPPDRPTEGCVHHIRTRVHTLTLGNGVGKFPQLWKISAAGPRVEKEKERGKEKMEKAKKWTGRKRKE